MLRSTGVAEEAACMVYLAISKLQVVTFEGGVEMVKGLRGDGGKRKGGESVRQRRREVRERRKHKYHRRNVLTSQQKTERNKSSENQNSGVSSSRRHVTPRWTPRPT